MRERLPETLARELRRNLGSSALVLHVVVELQIVERPRVEAEATVGREIPGESGALKRGQERARKAVEQGLTPGPRDVEVKSRGDVVRALLEHTASRDVNGAERGCEVVDPELPSTVAAPRT